MEYKKNILVVDDEEDLAQMLQRGFESEGYSTILASGGIEGLKILENLRPDLIILDLNMSDMGGIEFYKNICGDGSNPKFPVFVLTGRGEMEHFFHDMSIAGFMAKPFKFSQLLCEIDTIFKNDN